MTHNHFFIIENSRSSASINTTGDQICVSCSVSKGCVIVLRTPQDLQSTMSHKIPRSEGEGCFHQQSGEYTVAVFKQTMNKTLHAIPLNVSVVSVSFSTPTTRKLNDNSVCHYHPSVHVGMGALHTSELILYTLKQLTACTTCYIAGN